MSLSPGATNGPVDMSVSVTFYITEAALLTFLLGSATIAVDLQNRLTTAGANCEQTGAPTFTLLLSPTEQGLLMAALAPSGCRFSGGLRARVQNAMVQKLIALGAGQL